MRQTSQQSPSFHVIPEQKPVLAWFCKSGSSNHETYNAGIHGIKSRIAGLRSLDLRHAAANKLLEQGTPFPVLVEILGWSASTAVRMAKRYGHIRPEVQRQGNQQR
jgi:hypothetical protein